MGAGFVYVFNATLLFVLVGADLIFVLLTGRLRLGASYSGGEFRARDLRTGRVAGFLVAAAVLALLVVGALPIGFGHIIRTGLSWYVFHKDDVRTVISDSWAALGAVAATVALGHAVWRRNWGRALEWLWATLGLWSLTTAVAGGWALVNAHQRWWAYPWFFGWGVAGFALLALAANAGEAADRKQKRQDRLREREDDRRLGAENAPPRRDGLARLRAGKTREAGTGPAAGGSRGGETGMTQPGSGASAETAGGQREDTASHSGNASS